MRFLALSDTAWGWSSIISDQVRAYAFIVYLLLLLAIGWKIMSSFIISKSENPQTASVGRWQTVVAGFYLGLMCIQYWPIEGYGTSLIKVAFMCLAPVVLLFSLRYGVHWKGIACVAACLTWKFMVAVCQSTSFRPEGLAYSVAFFITYLMFYTLVQNGCFTLSQARSLLESLLWAFVIVLIIQQAYSLAGGGEWALINLNGARLHVLKCQSLTQEPSSSARIMGAMFYALLKIWEYQKGKRLSVGDLWSEHRWITVGFLYAMISMHSATAIFVLMLLMLYFFSWKYMLPIILVFFLLPTFAEVTESNELRRVIAVAESMSTGDREAVIQADGSASYRVLSILGMFNADYTDIHLWIGHGADSWHNLLEENPYAQSELLPGVLEFGLIDYMLALFLVWCCCIVPANSLPTLMFFCGVGGSTNNVAYMWGILMIFTIVSYFYKKSVNMKKVVSDDKQT